MGYNLITNIESCHIDIPGLLYYSHIPPAIIVLFFGIFILLKNKDNRLAGKVLFFISILFSLWVLLEGTIWFLYSSISMIFLWSLLGMLYASIHILSIYFVYTVIDKKDISLNKKYIFAILLLPIILLMPTKYNLTGFDAVNCQAIEGIYFIGYRYFIGIISIIWILILSCLRYKKAERESKKQIFLLSFGIISFLLLFSWSEITGSLTENFEVTQYGLFGMPIFMAFLAYLIVKYRTFNIKLLATQALVTSLIILIGSQFFFIKTFTNQILTGITLLLSSIGGYMLARSVKREVQQREELAKLLKSRENIVHLVSHKVKGSFTRTKCVFAEMIAGTFGVLPPKAKEIAKKGLDSDNEGIDTIDSILNASSLQAGLVKYNMKPVNFKEIIDEIVENKKLQAEIKGLKMETKIKDGNYTVTADKFWLKEAILNLVDNAVKFTDTGKVTVGLKPQENKILFYVKDTGDGITDEDKKVLFTEGGRGKNSLLKNTNSTGYGLFSVKIIIEAHKGKVWEESAVGKGSTFYVELPPTKK